MNILYNYMDEVRPMNKIMITCDDSNDLGLNLWSKLNLQVLPFRLRLNG